MLPLHQNFAVLIRPGSQWLTQLLDHFSLGGHTSLERVYCALAIGLPHHSAARHDESSHRDGDDLLDSVPAMLILQRIFNQ